MKKLLLVCSLVLFLAGAQAQQVITCYQYNEKTGEAIEPNTVWNISSAGGNLYVLLNNVNKIPSRKLIVNIDKMKDGQYVSYDIKNVAGDMSKNWAVLDYFFKEGGDYRISYLDSSYKMLANGDVSVKQVAEAPPAAGTNNKADAFLGSKVALGTGIDAAGNMTGENTVFSIGRRGGVLKMKVSNPYPFNTTKFFIDVYRKTDHGNYDLYESKTYAVYAENATWMYVSYVFKEPGEYKLALYTKENRYINTGLVTIIKTP